jgi:hypothetical protein
MRGDNQKAPTKLQNNRLLDAETADARSSENRKIPPRDNCRQKEALERVVQLYEATGRPEQAAGGSKSWKSSSMLRPRSKRLPPSNKS